MNGSGGRRTRWWEWVVLTGAVGVAALWAVKRLSEPVSALDFKDYFLLAARSVQRGDSPWSVVGYVHPPFTAAVVAVIDWFPGDPAWTWLVIQTVAGTAAVCLFVATFTRGLPLWQRSLVLAAASISLWATRPATRIFFLGQSDLLVLLGLAVTVVLLRAGRWGPSGVALGIGAMVKLWPALFCVLLLQRALPHRKRVFIGVAALGVATIISIFVFGGPRGLVELISAVGRYSNQGITSTSALGAGEALFSPTSPYVASIVDSPTLMWVTTIVLLLLAVTMLVIACARIADPALCLVVLVPSCLLLLSVSHMWYAILGLPLLWCWGSRLIAEPRTLRYWVAVTVGAAWWFANLYWAPAAVSLYPDGTPVISSNAYLVLLGTTLLHAVVGVAVAVLDTRADQFRPRPMPSGSRSAPQPSSTSAWSNANRSVMPPT